MTLQQLKNFIKITECGSISGAAKEMYVSQPSLTASVKKLEREYGIQLFDRSGRRIALTDDGREFLKYAREVADKADALDNRFKGGSPGD